MQRHQMGNETYYIVMYVYTSPPQDLLACGLSDCLSSVGRQFNSRFFGTWYMN